MQGPTPPAIASIAALRRALSSPDACVDVSEEPPRADGVAGRYRVARVRARGFDLVDAADAARELVVHFDGNNLWRFPGGPRAIKQTGRVEGDERRLVFGVDIDAAPPA